MARDKKGKDKQVFPLTGLNQQLLAFVRIANAMLEATDLDEILSAITREVSRVIEFDRSSVSFLTQDKESLTLRNIHKGGGGDGGKFGEGRLVPIDETSVIGWVALHKKALLRYDIEEDDQFDEIVTEEPLRSDIVVPLTLRDELIGTLNVGSYRPRAFSGTDLEVLENLGKFASLAIEHTMLRLEAQELGERYRTLQENANDIILIIDRNTGKLVEANRKSENVLGYMREKLVKKSYFELFAQEDQYQARRDFINILSQKSMTFVDRRMVGKDGNVIYVDINASLITLKDDLFIQMIVHNVSQRRMLEQQIIHQNLYLQQVNRKLTQVDQMKSEFLANISHELRTPLSIIIAYSESLKDPDMVEEERVRFINVIHENGESLLNLINNLLDLSKLEISDQKLSITLSHVHDVIKSIWSQMEKRAKKKGLKLTFEPGGKVPITYFDNNQIVQVILCLVQNAIKFTAEGGSVVVTTSPQDGEVWVQVKDTGTGIHHEMIDKIFETFHQGDGSSSRKWGGLGIGLALAKHIVELHKGRLVVDSEYGKGSTFTVALPLDTEEVFLRGKVVEQSLDHADVEDAEESTEETPAA